MHSQRALITVGAATARFVKLAGLRYGAGSLRWSLQSGSDQRTYFYSLQFSVGMKQIEVGNVSGREPVILVASGHAIRMQEKEQDTPKRRTLQSLEYWENDRIAGWTSIGSFPPEIGIGNRVPVRRCECRPRRLLCPPKQKSVTRSPGM
jgi:hypothetical protein